MRFDKVPHWCLALSLLLSSLGSTEEQHWPFTESPRPSSSAPHIQCPLHVLNSPWNSQESAGSTFVYLPISLAHCWQDDSASKGSCHQAWWSGYDPRTHMAERREPTNSKLPSDLHMCEMATCMLWHIPILHTCTRSIIKMWMKRKP